MAAVWCAEDLVLGRAVAVKVLAERFAHDDVAMRRFKREARAAARASNHAHVVTIFDVGDLEPEADAEDDPGRPFIVMEYLAGGTVADAIRVGAVRRQEAVRWIREAAAALDHAHARGIVHRDIKPANFLLNRSRVLHVADFGIARLVSEDTITTAGELFGTAAYLSPEQALGREATGASDRYALAVAAFELLAGERPFEAQHFAAQARQHIEDPPPNATARNRALPPTIDPVLIRGMAKEPDQRFETAGEFVDALETSLSGGIPQTAQTAPLAPRRGRGRGAGRIAAAAAAPLTAATAAVRVPARSTPANRVPAPAARADNGANGGNGARGGRGVVTGVGGAGSRSFAAAGSVQRSSAGHRRGGRLIALAALLIAIVGVGAVALAGLGGSPRRSVSKTAQTSKRVVAATPARRAHKHAAPAAPKATTTTSTPATTTPPAAASNPEQLQLAGHQELLNGDYPSAITTLKKALSAASKSSDTYAYALYDLGVALLRSGDAADAVPVLQQRAKIPNQTPVVLQALDQALRQSGQAPAASTPAPPSPQDHHGRGGNASGGAGLTPLHGPGHGNNGDGNNGNDGEHPNLVD
jgi:tetratricopeptide (TPR) repeat protein